MSLTIKEVIGEKNQLETQILNLISDFEKKCEVTVTEVKIQHGQRMGMTRKMTLGVDIPIILQ